jgi:23S rRNA pseudouridine2605 synthase
MRLNLFIAKSGYTSRRKADRLIKEGKVKVNRRTIYEPFMKINKTDIVEINNQPLKPLGPIYIMFNKPKGVTTTRKDKFARYKVIDFLPQEYKSVFPVGRLDKDSSGLLLLTNDGKLCYKLTHPKFCIEKEYEVVLDGVFKLCDCKKAKRGLYDGDDFLRLDAIKVIGDVKNHKTLCQVIVHEGKKRHLRRLFGKLGFRVEEIKRIRIGKLTLGDIAPGKYKIIDKATIDRLF